MTDKRPMGRQAAPPRSALPAATALTGGLEQPPDLREWLVVLRAHRGLVAGVTAVVAALASLLVYTSPSLYRAKAVIRLVDARRALAGTLVDGGSDVTLRTADPVLSQVEVLRSRATAGAVVDEMPILRIRTRHFPAGLVKDIHLAPEVGQDSLQLEFGPEGVTVHGRTEQRDGGYGAPIEVDGIRFTIAETPARASGTVYVLSRDEVIGGVTSGLTVKPRENTDVIDISFSAADPQRAQEVANRVAQVFQAASARGAQQEGRRRREFIETQLRFNDSLLAEARQAMSAFRGREPRSLADQAVDAGSFTAWQGRREELEIERNAYASVLGRLQDSSGGARRAALRNLIAASPSIAGNQMVSRLYGQLVVYENVRDSLTSGEWARAVTNPDVQRLHQQIATTENELVGAVQSVVASLDARIGVLRDLQARSAATARQLSGSQATEDALAERVENARRIADQLRAEHQKARIAEAVAGGQVEIVDLAPPGSPLGVGRARLLVFGLLVGLLLGGGSAFVADHLNRSVHRREDVADLGLTVLGIVPHAKQNGGSSAEETAPVVEAMRGIRFNVLHAYGAAGPAVFTLTSPGSREGKSFIATNLALAFADAGHRTLLVDGDLRRGSLHRLLNTRRKPGLTDLLHGEVAREDVIQVTPYPPLFFVAAGTRTPDAPELLTAEAMTGFLAFVRQNFNVVIVDSPPLGAGVDAYALGAVTGNVLLVLRLGATSREITEAKLDLLDRLPVRLLGTVLNDVPEHSAYYPYSYYLEGYAYEAERGREPRSIAPQPVQRGGRARR